MNAKSRANKRDVIHGTSITWMITYIPPAYRRYAEAPTSKYLKNKLLVRKAGLMRSGNSEILFFQGNIRSPFLILHEYSQ